MEVVKGKLVNRDAGSSSSLFQSLCRFCRSEALSTESGRITVVCAGCGIGRGDEVDRGGFRGRGSRGGRVEGLRVVRRGRVASGCTLDGRPHLGGEDVGPRTGEGMLLCLGNGGAREVEIYFWVLCGSRLEDVKVVVCGE